MIEIVTQPEDYCLIGNPVLFEMVSDTPDLIAVDITVGGKTVSLSALTFTDNGVFRADIDIAGVLRSFFDTESYIADDNPVIVPLEDFVVGYSVAIGGITMHKYAINGGISDELSAVLSDYGLDAFSYRLNNTDRQFLFTTRTNQPNISIRETEIFPFVFLHPGKSITFSTVNGNDLTAPALAKGTPCLMDFNTVRKTFFQLYGEVPSFFTVDVENSYAFDITITPGVIIEKTYLLRFRNSLGGFEQIEVTGEPYFTPEFADTMSYQKLTSLKTFEKRTVRKSYKNIITVESGYKSQQDLFFMLDMICSDQVYLVYPDQTIRRCDVSAEDVSIAMNMKTPQSISLKIELVRDDTRYSPKMDLARPGAWILETGYWNDFARWKDDAFWID